MNNDHFIELMERLKESARNLTDTRLAFRYCYNHGVVGRKRVSRQLADSYKKSGWLEGFGVGAYKRPKDDVKWVGALYTLQKLDGYTLHVGGKTAFE